ncbi:MAG: hypothetical protein NTU94_01840, partial [Planctomycetota bacterium]|nr:hypothetical protein [Planctomycetota bacterium]
MVIAVLLSLGCDHQGADPGEAGHAHQGGTRVSTESATRLFLQVRDRRIGNMETRLQLAKALAADREGEPWIILLLLGTVYPEELDQDELSVARARLALEENDRFIVAVLLANLRADAGAAVLWAVTYHLEDRERTPLSREQRRKNGTIVFTDGWTKPIRDLA